VAKGCPELAPPDRDRCHCLAESYAFSFDGAPIDPAILDVVTSSDFYVFAQFTRVLAGEERFDLSADYIFLQIECAHPDTCKAHAWDNFMLFTVEEFTEDQAAEKALLESREMVSSLRILGGYLMYVGGTPSSRAGVAAAPWTGWTCKEVCGDGWSHP
jgi:hypothetical protein